MEIEQAVGRGPDSGRTRDAVARLVLERGPQTAAAVAEQLGVSPAGVRRHLDGLVADGILTERQPRIAPGRGRGRPAKTYALTDRGRASFPHAYDDLASMALRYLRDSGGEQAVAGFAAHRAAGLERALADRTRDADSLAEALTSQGYAATTGPAGAPLGGVQICQHHCPVAHVAAEFPQLCDAETRAFERLLGTHVQRLATIAHGDGICTTYVPVTSPAPVTPGMSPHSQGVPA